MTRNRLATSRWSLAAIIAGWTFVTIAPAQPAGADPIVGVYHGSYAGDEGPINFKLSITRQNNGTLAGVFTLYLTEGTDTKAYICDFSGPRRGNRTFQLIRGKWENLPPSGAEIAAGMNGSFDPAGGNGAGQISGTMRVRPGPKFDAVRDPVESARMASVSAGTNEVEARATPIAQRGKRQTAAKTAVPSPSPLSPSAPVPGFTWRTAIWNGVYIGTYGTNSDDNVTAKLYVKFIDDGSVLGSFTGLFTFDVPPSPGAKPITYTYKLVGRPEVRMAAFYSAKPLGRPPPDAYAVTQLGVEFVRSLVKGTNGQLESIYNPDQISGRVSGSNGLPSNNFVAARDKDASANVDGLMAAQASAASVVTTAASAPPPHSPPSSTDVASSTRQPTSRPPSSPSSSAASDQIDNVMAAVRGTWTGAAAAPAVPSIEGVFNGTYTRENEPPAKFKLSITHTSDGLAGVATIYRPTESGTKAYTYSLKGTQVPYDQRKFELKVYDWETIPPKDFKNFRAMGFNGEFRSNVNQHTGRIVSVPSASRSDATFFVPTFGAAWDDTESADIAGTIAAQKGVGDADQVAALKAHAEVVKDAKPKELASRNLVRKSQAYWDSYRSDFIREVFDGGFASDVDDDPDFQLLFIAYVDLFAEKCHDYLPGHYIAVTITTTTTINAFVSTSSRTVDMDPRFVDKYVEYSGVEPEPGSDQEKQQTAKTFAIAGQIFHAGGPSHGVGYADANAVLHLTAAHGPLGAGGMDKFFAAEVKANGPSAALRQMGENLLRGATGKPSLQEAGAKIAGAEAETDRNLPPGRFTHLIDAAHAFYRDPAHARLASRFETAFDETLAAKYRGVMTPEEEYFYANDYENRFRGQIMQPRSYCKDPEWPRLHPAVEECIAELQ